MRMASIIPMIFLFIEDLQENMILIGCRDFTVADVPESVSSAASFQISGFVLRQVLRR